MAATIVPPIIALVTDRRITGTEDALVEAVDRAVGGGVNLVQLREKDLGQNDLLGLARRLRETIRDRALLFVNNEPNVALLSLADGVHLGESVAGLTRQAAAQGLVGRSVHDLRTAQQAADDGAHLLIAGPIHATRTHPGQRPAGLALVEEISGAVDVPVLGIGGITAANASDIIAAGASGVAVIREVLAAADPGEAAGQLQEAVYDAWKARRPSVSQQEVSNP